MATAALGHASAIRQKILACFRGSVDIWRRPLADDKWPGEIERVFVKRVLRDKTWAIRFPRLQRGIVRAHEVAIDVDSGHGSQSGELNATFDVDLASTSGGISPCGAARIFRRTPGPTFLRPVCAQGSRTREI